MQFRLGETKGVFCMRTLSKIFVSAVTGAGLLAATAVSASAGIACVGPICWHTHETYEYPPDARVVVHPDDWRWGANEKYMA